MTRVVILLFLLFLSLSSAAVSSDCNPPLDPLRAQYIVGYGTFMNELSKHMTSKNVGPNIPIHLIGYKRLWVLLSLNVPDRMAYLGVLPQEDAVINAAIFILQKPDDMYLFDKRENGYCRREISLSVIQLLVKQALPSAQFWLYVPSAPKSKLMDKSSQISQAYVDVFLMGCLQMQEANALKGFANQCIETTSGWDSHWIKDRVYRKRYYIQPSDEVAVNRLIKSMMPVLYEALDK